MPLDFSVSQRQTSFLDPFNDFARKDLTVEVRRDPLSGDVARILEFRARELGPVDHSAYLAREEGRTCPFCPENLQPMTARFTREQLPAGRLSRGQAVCFPNAFPYEQLNAVVVLTESHYLQPAEFTPEIIADGLLLAREAFERLGGGLAFGSVNWNYLMPAGAGLIHPHFQIAAGRGPTRFQESVVRRVRALRRRQPGIDVAAAYLDRERDQRARWVGRLGPAGWVAAFAPRAIFDLMALAPGNQTLGGLKPPQVAKLAEGVCRVLAYFQDKGVGAFNLALHTGLHHRDDLPLMLRLASRVEIPPMGVDEINYFEKLHDEMLTFIRPEQVAAELRAYWS
jgi:galactose-1-phosphate uridylyltransferase